jgi:adenylate cyclase
MEMKKQGKVTSIPLSEHHSALALLNSTVGGGAGSSAVGSLIPRIYRKWKGALPDLEHAPLFRVLGRKKGYDDGTGRAYGLSDENKDLWANLFEYKGSEQNVRLRFSVDRVGLGLDDVVITYGEDRGLTDGPAWEAFLEKLQESSRAERSPADIPYPPLKGWRRASNLRIGKAPVLVVVSRNILACAAAALVVIIGLVVWNFYFRGPPVETDSVLPLPDKSSIAVLPFANLSGDPKQDYLSDGITETIITGISKFPRLFVISRNSSFTYKGKPVMVQQAAKELGVKYILEGSVLKADGKIRITAQLVNGLTGAHLWSEKYDRDLKDLFELQDEVMMKVASSLQVHLTDGERAKIFAGGTKNFEALVKFLKAREVHKRLDKESVLLARKMVKEVIALDPNYPSAYMLLGTGYRHESRWQKGKAKEQSMLKAIEMFEKSLAMDPSQATTRAFLGKAYYEMGQYEKGMAECVKAIAVNPNDADAVMLFGTVLVLDGRFKEAVKALKEAIRLNPLPPWYYHFNLGRAYRDVGMYEESIDQLRKAKKLRPKHNHLRGSLAIAYMLSGREDEARKEAAEILKENPKYSMKRFVIRFYKDQKHVELLMEAARKAGLK